MQIVLFLTRKYLLSLFVVWDSSVLFALSCGHGVCCARQITPSESIGYVLSLVAFAWYNYVRMDLETQRNSVGSIAR
eukprot:m.211131 g.211131  ORF g.211131 m.211131 type:complete len:77 (-) comp19023_c0_seq27:87-317(-)